MKKLKWVVTGLVAVVVAVVVAGYVVLSTMDFEDLRETIQAEAKSATGRDLTISGPIDLKVSFTPAIAIEQVSFANADWGSRPEMVALERFEVEVALLPLLSGEVQVKRLVLVGPDILLETDAQGRGNWALEGLAEAAGEPAEDGAEPGEAGAEGQVIPSFDEVVIEGGVLVYRDGVSGEEMRVALNSLILSAEDSASPVDIDLDGSYNDQPFTLTGRLGAFRQLTEGPYPLRLTAEAGGATIEVDGEIAQPMAGQGVDLKVAARGESLAGLSGLAGGPLPPLGPYEVGTRVKMEGERVALTELAAKVGSSDLAGQATVDLAGARPAIEGALSSQLLDLADFQAGGAAQDSGSEPAAGAESPYVFTEDPLPLDGLKAADVNLKLAVATLRVQEKMELSDLDLTLALDAGHLRVQPARAGFAGGTLEASVDLNGAQATPSLAAALTGSEIDYGRLLKDMEVIDDVEGTLDLDVDLRGAGGSMRAIAAGLNGHTEVVSDEGVISNRLLKIISAGLSDVMGPLMGQDKDANLNCIVSRFAVENGVATSRALIVDTESFTVSGGGTVDLRSEELDLRMDTSTRRPSIASLAVPFNVRGTLKSPSVTPDPMGTALGAAKTVGMFVAPPVAIGSLIAERAVADSGENPCVAALEAAQSGEVPQEKSTLETITEDPGKALEGVGKGVGDALKGVGEGVKGLLGN